jgi:crossover junction endodeoxyribonuclease RuvC
MVILGIDPGTAITGYGVIDVKNNAVKWIDCGVIATNAGVSLPDRLAIIYSGIEKILGRYGPDRVAIEQAFYAKNVHTTLLLGHARGVAMLAAQQKGASISEYSPREIKKAITGNGNAEKSQVEYMVKVLLSPPDAREKSDAYDALAVALCDFYHGGSRMIAAALSSRGKKRSLSGGMSV